MPMSSVNAFLFVTNPSDPSSIALTTSISLQGAIQCVGPSSLDPKFEPANGVSDGTGFAAAHSDGEGYLSWSALSSVSSGPATCACFGDEAELDPCLKFAAPAGIAQSDRRHRMVGDGTEVPRQGPGGVGKEKAAGLGRDGVAAVLLPGALAYEHSCERSRHCRQGSSRLQRTFLMRHGTQEMASLYLGPFRPAPF